MNTIITEENTIVRKKRKKLKKAAPLSCMKLNRKDYSTERALTMLVGKRRRLLDYLKARDIERYRAIVKELGLRK